MTLSRSNQRGALGARTVPSGLLVFWSAEFDHQDWIFENSDLAPGPVPQMISATQDYVLHENLLSRVGAPELLARLMRWRRFPAGPAITAAVLSAPDGRSAIDYVARCVNVTNSHVTMERTVIPGGVRVALSSHPKDKGLGELFCVAALLFVARAHSLVAEHGLSRAGGGRIHTTLPPADPLLRARPHWPCEIVFSEEENVLELSDECLATKNPSHDAATWRRALSKLKLGEQERSTQTLMSRVAALCEEALEARQRAPSIADCAQACGVSERTLARRLSEEGSSFGAILDEVRRGRAERLMRLNLPVSALASELGYVSQSSMCRSFRRWFGCSFGDYRRRA